MNPLQKWLVVAAVAFLGAGVAESHDSPPSTKCAEEELAAGKSWRERYLLLGQETYQHACASCHDEGVDNAPAKGDREAWSNRSPLWSAVLLGHAKNGYLNMPARGGHAELTDRAVEAAGEYMLSETFPEKLVD